MRRWRNGRRGALKRPCPKGRVGSIPTRRIQQARGSSALALRRVGAATSSGSAVRSRAPVRLGYAALITGGRREAHGTARSSCAAREMRSDSCQGPATICTPTGRPASVQ